MRKMMMTSSRMMVTRQPIRMGVFPLTGGALAEGTVLNATGSASQLEMRRGLNQQDTEEKIFTPRENMLLL
ncbi:hypothetical protein EYF80_037556 [Liparis tanakae]|uniref:Uncharacterized protein n=1 Tax=Liparis tanakae TaxID=230148 RepID=A0A4Z2GFY4_9TELE|nr:hypothetical protein EYF80_037556 [Liparis tanakae]